MAVVRFLLVVVVVLLLAVPAAAGVPPMISYQGKLMQPSGSPVTDGTYSIRFAMYDAQENGNTLWSEVNPGVQVKGGLFSVLLGSVVNLPGNLFDSPDRWFGVKVGTDPEMVPRQRIASVGYALKSASADTAATVPDASITAAKLAPSLTIPAGAILIWSGQPNQVPAGWALCNGTNGTPDLRDRFVVGAGSGYLVGANGGEAQHTLAIAELPSHNHSMGSMMRTNGLTSLAQGGLGMYYSLTLAQATDYTGGGEPHENRPPYYALCYIMKLAY